MTQGHHHVLKHPALCYMHENVATGDQRQCEALPESGESRELVAVASISMQFGSDPQAAGITLTQPRQLVEFIRIARYPQQAAIGERRVDILAQQPIPALEIGSASCRASVCQYV